MSPPAAPAHPDFASPEFLRAHIRAILAFYEPHSRDPSGGFFHAYLGNGTVYDTRVRHLVSSTRFVFNHAMAARHFDSDHHRQLAQHALAFLHAAHRQADGSYAWLLDWHDGRASVRDATEHAYGLAFVVLAHAHALMAGLGEARQGLTQATARLEHVFWEPAQQLHADERSPAGVLASYRGQNANMHACEAYLAAHEATADAAYLARAYALAESVTQRLAGLAGGRIWEHYAVQADGRWRVDWDYNRHDRSNIFRPWGFQTGHFTEWAKLLLMLERRMGGDAPAWLRPTAQRLFDDAWSHGWDAQHGGLVYGFGPDNAVCDGDKYFWVQAESLAAAAWLATGAGTEGAVAWSRYHQLWAYAWEHLVDHQHGAWWRILTPDNRRIDDQKSPPGKTDYHTMGACWDVLRALGALSQ